MKKHPVFDILFENITPESWWFFSPVYLAVYLYTISLPTAFFWENYNEGRRDWASVIQHCHTSVLGRNFTVWDVRGCARVKSGSKHKTTILRKYHHTVSILLLVWYWGESYSLGVGRLREIQVQTGSTGRDELHTRGILRTEGVQNSTRGSVRL